MGRDINRVGQRCTGDSWVIVNISPLHGVVIDLVKLLIETQPVAGEDDRL